MLNQDLHRRSFLMVPATKLQKFWTHIEKLSGDALPDTIVVDLEDSVPPERKSEATADVIIAFANILKRLPRPIPVAIKIDNPRTPTGRIQLDRLAASDLDLSMIKIGKVESAEDMDCISKSFPGQTVSVLPTIETPMGLRRIHDIVDWCCDTDNRYVSFGAGDMSSSLGVQRDYGLAVMQAAFCTLVLSCAARNLHLVDSPSRAIPSGGPTWSDRVRQECEWAFSNGAAAKTAIHPEQITIIHGVWDQMSGREWARDIVDQFHAERTQRAIRDKRTGDYVGSPVLRHASRILEKEL